MLVPDVSVIVVSDVAMRLGVVVDTVVLVIVVAVTVDNTVDVCVTVVDVDVVGQLLQVTGHNRRST